MGEGMSDRELLELAAKAAGYEYSAQGGYIVVDGIPGNWNPLFDDGDALRLAVKLDMIVTVNRVDDRTEVYAGYNNDDLVRIVEPHNSDPYAATRRAIVRAAAEIGKTTKQVDG